MSENKLASEGSPDQTQKLAGPGVGPDTTQKLEVPGQVAETEEISEVEVELPVGDSVDVEAIIEEVDEVDSEDEVDEDGEEPVE